MIRALLAVRFRAIFVGMTAQGRRKKTQGVGMVILFIFLYLYLAAVICGMMGFTFWTLAESYHAMDLDWLYFTMAGLMGLGFSVIGSVFTTQSQLYDAKDNELLLSMPIPARAILLSRMIPLLALNLLFAGLVMVPAIIVYAVFVTFSPVALLAQVMALLGTVLLAQAIACLFGWLLHLLLSKLNKSFASMLYVVVFLALYFAVYSQASQILNAMAINGQAIAQTLHSWVWPLYAMGLGCLGNIPLLLAFLAICAAVFCAVYAILSLTFLKTATMQRGATRKRKLRLDNISTVTPEEAVIRKEFRKFISTPVYLTNMGLGVFLIAALPVAGLIFRKDILEMLELLEMPQSLVPLLICAVLSFTVSTVCISTPSVSLEGKSIWILKSMPISPKQILTAKLRLHCRLSVPVTAVAALILAATYGCSVPECVLTALVSGLLATLCGLVGMLAGLQWARLDYISEAYPCKQSPGVLVTMLSMMGLPLVIGLLYGLVLATVLHPTVFLGAVTVLLALLCFGAYRLMVSWGVNKWEALQ